MNIDAATIAVAGTNGGVPGNSAVIDRQVAFVRENTGPLLFDRVTGDGDAIQSQVATVEYAAAVDVDPGQLTAGDSNLVGLRSPESSI